MTLTHGIKEGFTYTRRAEHGTQEPVVTVRIGRGSCRDFALLMIEAVRSLGLAARFVSGYLHVPSRDGPEYAGGGSTHAWCKSICRAPAGSNLIRQTASLEIVTSSASLSRVTPAKQFRSPVPTLEIRRTS